MNIDHLRMATKYSFHVRLQGQNKDQKEGRADLNGNILKDNLDIDGQTIIIPTKGCKLNYFTNMLCIFRIQNF